MHALEDPPNTELLARRIKEGRVFIVVGTGVSLAATGDEKCASWKGLIENGIDKCKQLNLGTPAWADRQTRRLKESGVDKLLRIANDVSKRLGWDPNNNEEGGDWYEWLQETLGALRPDYRELIDAISDLNTPLATLNYDHLLSKVTGRSPLTWQEPAKWIPVLQGKDREAILHLHGHWRSSSSVVLGTRSYEEMMGKRLTQELQHTLPIYWSLLFIGCSGTLKDPNFSALLGWMRAFLRTAPHRHFLLLSQGERLPLPKKQLEEARITPLRYGDGGLLTYIRSLAPSDGAEPARDRSGMPRKIYIAYSREDKTQVRRLYTALKARDLNPSPDMEDFRQLRDTEMQKAVKEAKLFLACLSRRSINDRNFKSVLGMLEAESTYLRLIRLEECNIPNWTIPKNRNLRQMGATDLWEPDALQHLLTEIEHIFGEATPQKTYRKEASISIPRVNVDIRDPEKLGSHETFRDPDFRVSALGGKTGMSPAMVIIPAGDFWMGSPMSELNRDHDEGPQRRVNFSQPFAVGLFPVTFMEYELFAEATKKEMPSDEGWGRGYRPVINVTWEDAKAYTEWLSGQTDRFYRLLSEAEWEYACRAGTTTHYSWGNDIGPYHANWAGSGINMTSDVGSYEANPWKLYDMYGNVREWLEDLWHESYEGAPSDGSAWTWPSEIELRVIRGGAWNDGSRILRSACRSHGRPQRGYRCNFIGFRIAMSLQ
jgi:formylglycine-generating enzyme required for sulfatase activity